MPESIGAIALETVLENAEAVADTFTDNELLANIPVFGTAVKLWNLATGVQQRIFIAKLNAFLFHVGPHDPRVVAKWKRRMEASPEDVKRIAENIILIIDKLNDLRKAEYLARLFRAYIDEIITASDLFRLAHAADMALADDLEKLLALQSNPERSKEPWMRYLSGSGLTETVVGSTWDDVGAVYYEVTLLGKQFQVACAPGPTP